jgi:hypothetical protein
VCETLWHVRVIIGSTHAHIAHGGDDGKPGERNGAKLSFGSTAVSFADVLVVPFSTVLSRGAAQRGRKERPGQLHVKAEFVAHGANLTRYPAHLGFPQLPS